MGAYEIVWKDWWPLSQCAKLLLFCQIPPPAWAHCGKHPGHTEKTKPVDDKPRSLDRTKKMLFAQRPTFFITFLDGSVHPYTVYFWATEGLFWVLAHLWMHRCPSPRSSAPRGSRTWCLKWSRSYTNMTTIHTNIVWCGNMLNINMSTSTLQHTQCQGIFHCPRLLPFATRIGMSQNP